MLGYFSLNDERDLGSGFESGWAEEKTESVVAFSIAGTGAGAGRGAPIPVANAGFTLAIVSATCTVGLEVWLLWVDDDGARERAHD